jgi:hypothetical protein
MNFVYILVLSFLVSIIESQNNDQCQGVFFCNGKETDCFYWCVNRCQKSFSFQDWEHVLV